VKKIILLSILLTFLLAASGTAAAGEVQVIIEEEKHASISTPLVIEDIPLLSMREYFEMLGAQVSWQEETRTAVGINEDLNIRIPIDSEYAVVNGNPIEMEVPAKIIDGSTYISLDTAGQLAGYYVTWEEEKDKIKASKTKELIEKAGNEKEEELVETVSVEESEETQEPEKSEYAEESEEPEAEEVQVVHTETGVASWYGSKFHGNRTSSGETFNKYELTAAHPDLPFNTYVEVTFLQTGSSTTVRINDRGPHVGGRIIDLSRAAAEKIGLRPYGVGEVTLEVLDK